MSSQSHFLMNESVLVTASTVTHPACGSAEAAAAGSGQDLCMLGSPGLRIHLHQIPA